MMNLRFQVPVDFFLKGPAPEHLELRASFPYKTLRTEVILEGENSIFVPDSPPESRHFRHVHRLQFTLTESDPNGLLTRLVDTSDHTGLVRLLSTVANRCIRPLRCLGLLTHLREVHPRGQYDPKLYLETWKVEVSRDATTYAPAYPEEDLTPEALATWIVFHRADSTGDLEANHLARITEGIEDGTPLPPEEEFLANALDHFRRENPRLALVESIIGLEIVLSRYLREYLKTVKNVPQNRLKQFLSPQFPLSTRLAGILDLTLRADDLEKIQLEKVMAAVNWRNHVVHKTGHLPEVALERARLGDHLVAVSSLTHLLAWRTSQIAASADIRRFEQEISSKYSVVAARIEVLPEHYIAVELRAGWPEGRPAPELMDNVVKDVVLFLQARDPRFFPDKHLKVAWIEFPEKMYATWTGTKWNIVGS